MSIDLALSGVLDEIHTLVLDRHQKYGPLNISSAPGGPLNGLRVRLYDKLARINHALDSGGQVDFDDDSFRDAFLDVVGYGLIGLLVLDGEWPGATAAEKPLAEYVEHVEKAGAISHRYSHLAAGPSADVDVLDAWPIGTTFKPDNGDYLWTREPDGWRWTFDGSRGNRPRPSLEGLVRYFGYADGTVTTPGGYSTMKGAA